MIEFACTNVFCFHYRPAPKNEDEMMVDIFAYIDRIFAIVRPRKLLYMAIDGVVCIILLQSTVLVSLVYKVHYLFWHEYNRKYTIIRL